MTMNLPQKFLVPLLLLIATGGFAEAQTVLFDFQDLEDPFGHFGTVTAGSELLPDCGAPGNICASHTGRFTELVTSPNEFGMVDIGPFTGPTEIDLSGFIGYSIDARFIRDTDGIPGSGLEEFTGLSPIKFGVQWNPSDPCNGSMNECSDSYLDPIELTETFTTYTVMFDDLGIPGYPTTNDLSVAQIKMLMLTGEFDPDVSPPVKTPGTDWSDGFGRLEFDNIIGILPPPPVPGDYNGDQVVNTEDYTVWRDTLGSTTDLRADGDESGTVDHLDHEFWKTRFGNTSGSGSLVAANIPEPHSLFLLMAGCICLAIYSRSCKESK